MATSRPELANEVWFMIIDHLDRYDLLNLSLVSKQLHNLAEPALYSRLEPAIKEDWDVRPEELVSLFFRSILENPRLALHINAVSLCVPSHGSLDVSFLRQAHHSLLEKRISDLELPRRIQRLWYESIESEQNWDPVVAFILLLSFRSLSVLVIDNCGYLSSYYFIRRLLLSPKGPESNGTFLKLDTVGLRHSFENGDNTAEFSRFPLIEPFLSLPSITKIIVRGFSERSPWIEFEKNSTISVVTVRDCDFSDSVLEKFLKSLRALKILHWIHADCVTVAEFCDVISHLPRLKASIEELDIIRDGRYLPSESPLNLSGFTALKTLTVDCGTAFGWIEVPRFETPLHLRSTGFSAQNIFDMQAVSALAQNYFDSIRGDPRHEYDDDRISDFRAALPKCIESITIIGCDCPMFSCIWRFITTEDGQLPNLKYLTLTFQCANEGEILRRWDQRLLTELHKKADERGIELVCEDEELAIAVYSY